MIDDLMKHFVNASDDQIHKGMSWYWDAHHFCKKVSKYTRTPMFKVVGILAALSPRNKWNRNKIDTIELIKRGKRGKFCTFNANRDKALRILKADSPEEVYTLLNGRKVQSFYKNILHPFKNGTVTVDIWAMRSVGLDRAPNKTLYNSVEEAYRELGSLVGIKPHEAQAIIWGVVRDAS